MFQKKCQIMYTYRNTTTWESSTNIDIYLISVKWMDVSVCGYIKKKCQVSFLKISSCVICHREKLAGGKD